MNSLEQMFPSLTLFSDLNWDTVKAEYESDYSDLSFPEYLQQKCIEGDCPPYLFELAFFEQALFELKTMTKVIPSQNGIYLNPYSLFLSLEFDIKRMLEDAGQGKIDIHEKQHVVCLFKDKNDQISIMEATDEDLFLLQKLEEGAREDDSFVENHQKITYEKFLQTGLIWSVSSGQLF
jgi:hypothetical protein